MEQSAVPQFHGLRTNGKKKLNYLCLPSYNPIISLVKLSLKISRESTTRIKSKSKLIVDHLVEENNISKKSKLTDEVPVVQIGFPYHL